MASRATLRSRNNSLRGRAMRQFKSANIRALGLVGFDGEEILRNLVSTPYPPPSAPGEPPHARTKTLRDNTDHEVIELEEKVRIGYTDVDYSRWLELGTERMAARPSLQPMLQALRRHVGVRIKASYGQVRLPR